MLETRMYDKECLNRMHLNSTSILKVYVLIKNRKYLNWNLWQHVLIILEYSARQWIQSLWVWLKGALFALQRVDQWSYNLNSSHVFIISKLHYYLPRRMNKSI